MGLLMLASGARAVLAAQSTPGSPSPAAAAQAPTSTAAPAYSVPVLARRVTLDLDDVPFEAAVQAISRAVGEGLVYDDQVGALRRRVTLHLHDVAAGDALRDVLRGTGVRLFASADGRSVMLTRGPQPPAADSTRLEVSVTTRGEVFGPVGGARVELVEAQLSRLTQSDGRVTILGAPPGPQTVRVTALGYGPTARTVVLSVDSTTHLTIVLTPIAAHLDEVVTTATGSLRRIEVGNSIGTIAVDSLVNQTPLLNMSDVLATRVPGMAVLQTGGFVGAPSRIRIRGANSDVLSNNPVIIVDGVRVNGLDRDFPDNADALNRGVGAPSRLDDIDPENVESVEILKGPLAATLYGENAANGVIIIKTKQGQSGQTRWATHAQTTVSMLPGQWPDNYFGFGQSPIHPGVDIPCRLADVALGGCTSIDSVLTFNSTSIPRYSLDGTGGDTRLGAQVSGGSDRFQYFVGGNWQDALGVTRLSESERERIELARPDAGIPDWILRPNSLSKADFTSRATAHVSPTADVSLSTTFLRQNTLGGNDDAALAAATDVTHYRDTTSFLAGEQFATRVVGLINRGFTALNANWRPTPWLTGRADAGVDYTSYATSAILRPGDCLVCANGSFDVNGHGNDYRSGTLVYTGDVSGTATASLTRTLRASTSAGFQYEHNETNGVSAFGNNFFLGTSTLAFGSATYNSSEDAIAGWYLEEQVSVANEFYLTVAGRQDVGSAFGRDAHIPIYPKLNASWVVSQDPRFPGHAVVSQFRVRGAYGQSGVQPQRQDAIPNLSQNGIGIVDSAGQLQGVPIIQLTSLGNPRLRPERSEEVEGGFDLGLWGDRVLVEATYYTKTNHDDIVTVALPPSVATSPGVQPENIGTVRNTGVEVSATARLVDARAVSWDITVNATSNHNKLLSFANGVTSFSTLFTFAKPGYPLFGQWARPILSYTDGNHDGILETNELVVGDSAVFVGPTQPTLNLTYNTGVGLFSRRLRLSAVFDYQGGWTQFDQLDFARCQAGLCRGAVDPHASLAEQAAALAAQPYDGSQPTTYGFLQRISTLRLSELSVAFSLPPSVVRLLRCSSASIAVMGRNLGLWTNYHGRDPEVNSMGDVGDALFDLGTTPQTRDWGVRLNLGF